MIIEKAPPSMGTVGCDGEPYTWRRQPEKWRPIDRRAVLYSRVCGTIVSAGLELVRVFGHDA